MTLPQRFRKYKTKHVDRNIDLLQVHLKFNGVCQCCGIKTVMGHHPQISNSSTIEHIIPLSKGGNHVWGNVELLCLDCNMKRNKEIMKKDTEFVKSVLSNKVHKTSKVLFSIQIGKYAFIVKKDINES